MKLSRCVLLMGCKKWAAFVKTIGAVNLGGFGFFVMWVADIFRNGSEVAEIRRLKLEG